MAGTASKVWRPPLRFSADTRRRLQFEAMLSEKLESEMLEVLALEALEARTARRVSGQFAQEEKRALMSAGVDWLAAAATATTLTTRGSDGERGEDGGTDVTTRNHTEPLADGPAPATVPDRRHDAIGAFTREPEPLGQIPPLLIPRASDLASDSDPDPDPETAKQISSHTPSQDTAGLAMPAALPPDEIGATPPEEPRAETPWPSVPGFSMPFEAPSPPAARRRDEQPAPAPTLERPKRAQKGYPEPLRVRTTDPENGKVPPPTAMRLADVLDALRAANLGVDCERVTLLALTAYPRKNVEEAIKRAVKASGKSPAYALGILRKSLCREKGFEFELVDEALATRIVSDNAAYGYGYTGNKLEVTDAAS